MHNNRIRIQRHLNLSLAVVVHVIAFHSATGSGNQNTSAIAMMDVVVANRCVGPLR